MVAEELHVLRAAEVHENPAESKVDPDTHLSVEEMISLLEELSAIRRAVLALRR